MTSLIDYSRCRSHPLPQRPQLPPAWRASHKGEWEHPKRKGRTQQVGCALFCPSALGGRRAAKTPAAAATLPRPPSTVSPTRKNPPPERWASPGGRPAAGAQRTPPWCSAAAPNSGPEPPRASLVARHTTTGSLARRQDLAAMVTAVSVIPQASLEKGVPRAGADHQSIHQPFRPPRLHLWDGVGCLSAAQPLHPCHPVPGPSKAGVRGVGVLRKDRRISYRSPSRSSWATPLLQGAE